MAPIHVKNLQLFMIEIYKTRSGLSPPFMKSIFAELNTGYDLRHGNDSQLPKVHTTTNGIETISFLGNRLWLILLKEVRGIPMILNVKKLVAEMTANETVK